MLSDTMNSQNANEIVYAVAVAYSFHLSCFVFFLIVFLTSMCSTMYCRRYEINAVIIIYHYCKHGMSTNEMPIHTEGTCRRQYNMSCCAFIGHVNDILGDLLAISHDIMTLTMCL